MNKSTVIVLSISAIALLGFAAIQLNQADQVAPLSNVETITSVDNSVSSPVQQSNNNQKSKIIVQKNALSSGIKRVSENEIRPTTQVLRSKSVTGANENERPSDHNGEYSQARPHGHESHNSHSHQSAPMPPGEPKKSVEAQQPAN